MNHAEAKRYSERPLSRSYTPKSENLEYESTCKYDLCSIIAGPEPMFDPITRAQMNKKLEKLISLLPGLQPDVLRCRCGVNGPRCTLMETGQKLRLSDYLVHKNEIRARKNLRKLVITGSLDNH